MTQGTAADRARVPTRTRTACWSWSPMRFNCWIGSLRAAQVGSPQFVGTGRGPPGRRPNFLSAKQFGTFLSDSPRPGQAAAHGLRRVGACRRHFGRASRSGAAKPFPESRPYDFAGNDAINSMWRSTSHAMSWNWMCWPPSANCWPDRRASDACSRRCWTNWSGDWGWCERPSCWFRRMARNWSSRRLAVATSRAGRAARYRYGEGVIGSVMQTGEPALVAQDRQ